MQFSEDNQSNRRTHVAVRPVETVLALANVNVGHLAPASEVSLESLFCGVRAQIFHEETVFGRIVALRIDSRLLFDEIWRLAVSHQQLLGDFLGLVLEDGGTLIE